MADSAKQVTGKNRKTVYTPLPPDVSAHALDDAAQAAQGGGEVDHGPLKQRPDVRGRVALGREPDTAPG
jgi:hypothetical protein